VEVKQIIAEVAARHGVRIDEDDPAFCIVTLNQLMLEESARAVVADIRKATREFEEAGERLQARLGTVLAGSQKQLVVSLQRELDRSARNPSSRWKRLRRWLTAGVLSILVAFTLGVVIGVIFG